MTFDAAEKQRAIQLTEFRYVVWGQVDEYLRRGWCFSADLGLPHSQYAVLMEWRCCCVSG